MAIYLKEFETQAAYDAAQSGLILPNVSLTLDNNRVHYNPSTPVPPTPSHDYVEIGGIKWATMNIGATAVTDAGLYFQWGDTQGYTASQVGSGEGQKYFVLDDYKYYDNHDYAYTKYNGTDGLVTLVSGDDAVTAAWGGNWRMPTTSELQALGEAVTTAWTNDYQGSGVAGLVCTDNTDNSKELFFPAVGYCREGEVSDVGSYGGYWSSSTSADDYGNSYSDSLYFTLYDVGYGSYSPRYDGYAVRGVLDEN